MNDWQFWVDRGGTFTDVIGVDADGTLHALKLLSERPDQYPDAAIEGLRRILHTVPANECSIAAVKMGTTVATNALLERSGEPTILLTTQGLADVLRIGTQQRPDIFALDIAVAPMLYSDVIEAHERIDADGTVSIPLNEEQLLEDLKVAARRGYSGIAVVLMHAWRNPAHELRAAEIAASAGFKQISVSHEVSPTIRIVPRGDTTLVDAYLTPVLARHVLAVEQGLQSFPGERKLEFMQSHGGLTAAAQFRGCNSILSGPAGGVVGVAKIASEAGFERVIGFDMGGTSTDVALYSGEFERTSETTLSGVRIATPMLHVHTIAAGGGSIIEFIDGRVRVGPESAGANPGPAAYGNDGPLTLTDANVLLGRIQPEHFPSVFGPHGDAPLDSAVVRSKFAALSAISGLTPAQLAEGALEIAVENMAQAIAQISTRRGIDLNDFALCAFGGAGGQHACRVAETLGINQIVIHPLAGLLSALGIGLAEQRKVLRQTVEQPLTAKGLAHIFAEADAISASLPDSETLTWRIQMKNAGADTTLTVPLSRNSTCAELESRYRSAHAQQFGFDPSGEVVVESLEVESTSADSKPDLAVPDAPTENEAAVTSVRVAFAGDQFDTPIYRREGLAVNEALNGPAIIAEANSTTVVEPGWQVHRDKPGNLILTRRGTQTRHETNVGGETAQADPVRLELFNNAFMHAAEQMGVILQRSAHSVNIKERMDFSCAIFSSTGELIANAPHVPVHLGSMSEAVKALLSDYADLMKPGSVLMTNDPLRGGTHLPDVTVVTSVHFESEDRPDFIVASRAHHADVGGMTPGSMPPFSRTWDDEGALFHGTQIVRNGEFQTEAVSGAFRNAQIPARNPARNRADIQSQIAANARGADELRRLVDRYGIDQCRQYVRFMRANAAEAVGNALSKLHDGEAHTELDDGERIRVRIQIDGKQALIDFDGTSPMSDGNLNAPSAVARSAVLYTLRVLVAHEIPLNSGCLEPVKINLPPGSLVNPAGPVAVVGGNVETSQRIVDALLRAFGVLASCQGTMNNLTFGNEHMQYYETICGGAGASTNADGADAVHTHMTNSRLTDPEVLEWRFPVRLRRFAIRMGSGGTGRQRGGNGVVREIEFLEPMTIALLTNCRRVAPHGLAGGEPGSPGINMLRRRDGRLENLGGTAQTAVQAGDVLSIATPGGGGFGAET